MATKVENEKGFLVIKCTKEEISKNGMSKTCDNCRIIPEEGYLVAVLGLYMCEKCYNDWTDKTSRELYDLRSEERVYQGYANYLGI